MEIDSFGELDDIGVLREAELFRNMPEAVIRTIVLQSHIRTYPAGAWVVRRGDQGDSLFVVKSGVVEVLSPAEGGQSRPLAYLGRGECLGELAILTNSPRHADVRVPEHAELIVIGKELFHDLLSNHSVFGAQLSVILAQRLVNTLQNLPGERGNKELQGSFLYFDLATVIQTLISSSQSGFMKLQTSTETSGTIVFRTGDIVKAAFGHRTGDEAIHQLFQVNLDGQFLFSSAEVPPDKKTALNITIPAMALVLDSIRLQDELVALRHRLPPSTAPIERAERRLNWPQPEGKREAKAIWEALRTPKKTGEILEASSSCHYHAAVALIQLLETEQVMPALE